MPLRKVSILAGTAAVASLGIAIIVVLALQSDDTSALPGVPESDLREQRLEVELADASQLQVSPEFAESVARPQIFGRDITDIIPVRLRSETGTIFDGFAWAIVYDTSTGLDGPWLTGPPYHAYVRTDHDYFVAFVDWECGFFLKVTHPGRDYNRFPASEPGVRPNGSRPGTPYCDRLPAPAP